MSKYSYLKDFALDKLSAGNITIAGIARLAKDTFNLVESPEQIRKIISKEINKKAQVNYYSSVVDSTYVPPTFTITTASSEDYVNKTKFTTPGTYLVLGCAHVPGHNVSLINGVTKLISELRDLKGLILLGDFLDCNSLSGHDRGRFTALGLNLSQEYEIGNEVLDQLTKPLPKSAEKIYFYGNHEDRYNRYMADMQNAKTPITSPEQGLKLKERGFTTFTNWNSDYITLGEHLDLIHGQYYNTHCAKQHIDKFRGSIMFAHTHRVQSYVEGSTAGFNIGWAGDINSPLFNYADRGMKKQWQNGFSLVTIDEVGNYYVQQIFHHNNKFYYNGKAFS